jgi:hypothetical protein
LQHLLEGQILGQVHGQRPDLPQDLAIRRIEIGEIGRELLPQRFFPVLGRGKAPLQ